MLAAPELKRAAGKKVGRVAGVGDVAVAAGVAWLLLLPAYAARAVLLNAHGRMLDCTALALTLLVPLLPLLPSGHPHNMLLAYPALLLVVWLRLLLGDWVLRFIERRPAPENAKAA